MKIKEEVKLTGDTITNTIDTLEELKYEIVTLSLAATNGEEALGFIKEAMDSPELALFAAGIARIMQTVVEADPETIETLKDTLLLKVGKGNNLQ